ncbi:hypothetical protein RDABS01_004552 [Bienertia sinuspersici]
MMVNNAMASYYEVGNTSNMIHDYPNSNLRAAIETNSNKSIIASGTTTNLMLCSSTKAKPTETKAVAACKTHKEAERRRRKRINAHLAILRTLLPNLIKTDKASVLAEVVRRVRELKKATVELTSNCHHHCNGCNACLLPGDMDEVNLQRSEYDNNTLIATLCCEDRPELIVDLTRALRSVKGKVLKAEMATVGGRTKSVLWVRGVGFGRPEGLLRRALKVVADKPTFSSSGLGHGLRMSRQYH